MTVELKGDLITGLDASPRVYYSPVRAGGKVRNTADYIVTNTDDAMGSIYRFVRVPSRARIVQILASTDGGSTNGTADIGLYHTSADGGAVIDADLFASAWAIKTAAANTDVTYESGVITVDKRHKMLWEILGLSADPNLEYDIAMTVVEAVSVAADKITLSASYATSE